MNSPLFEHFSFFIYLAVPGIILIYTRSIFLDGRMPNLSTGIAAYVAVSAVYLGCALFFIPAHKIIEHPLRQGVGNFLVFLVFFIVPAVIGAALGYSTKTDRLRSILSKMRLNVLHPISSTWDWKFSKPEESWVLVVLKDGTKWAGIFGSNSFASSGFEQRDLFLEEVYEIDEHNEWHSKGSSVLIVHDQIQSVEFWSGNNHHAR